MTNTSVTWYCRYCGRKHTDSRTNNKTYSRKYCNVQCQGKFRLWCKKNGVNASVLSKQRKAMFERGWTLGKQVAILNVDEFLHDCKCVICKKKFKGTSRYVYLCSDECREKYEAKKQEEAETMPCNDGEEQLYTKKCSYCGMYHLTTDKNAKFCSSACEHLAEVKKIKVLTLDEKIRLASELHCSYGELGLFADKVRKKLSEIEKSTRIPKAKLEDWLNCNTCRIFY